jgi:hypothetical protein
MKSNHQLLNSEEALKKLTEKGWVIKSGCASLVSNMQKGLEDQMRKHPL